MRRDESDCAPPKGFFIILNPQVLVPVSAPRGETGDVFLDRTRSRSPFDSIPLAVGDLGPVGWQREPQLPEQKTGLKAQGPPGCQAEDHSTRLPAHGEKDVASVSVV